MRKREIEIPFQPQPGSGDRSAVGLLHSRKTQPGGSGAVVGGVDERGIQPSVTSSEPAPDWCSVKNCSLAVMTQNSTRPPLLPWALAPAPLPQGQVATTMRLVGDWQSCQMGVDFGVEGWRILGTRMGPPLEVVVVLLLLAQMRVRVSMTLTEAEVSLTNRGYQCFVEMH